MTIIWKIVKEKLYMRNGFLFVFVTSYCLHQYKKTFVYDKIYKISMTKLKKYIVSISSAPQNIIGIFYIIRYILYIDIY